MPSHCVVPFCNNRGGHRFPRDRILREKWLIAIGRVNYTPSEHSIVCREHFKKENYRLPKESVLLCPTPTLKKDAVPSKFACSQQQGTNVKKTKKEISEESLDNKIFKQRCSVIQCKSSKEITLHSCPKQENVINKWAEVFKVSQEVVANMLVCSQHFVSTDFLRAKHGERHVLKLTAVPSQKLPRSTRVIIKNNSSARNLIPQKNIKREVKMTEAVETVSGNGEKEADPQLTEVECRACLKKMRNKNMCNIFQSWVPEWTGMEATIAEDMAKLANVEVNDTDKHSKVICEPCYRKLLDAATFASKVRDSDLILRQRYPPEDDILEKVWPKPIQVDKNLNGEVFNGMDIEIKQEILSDDDGEQNVDSSYVPVSEFAEGDIKVEPEDNEPTIKVTVNGTISENSSSTENKTLLNGTGDFHAIITDSLGNTAIVSDDIENTTSIDAVPTVTNGTDEYQDEQYLEAVVKEEPPSEEDMEVLPDLSLECILCTKSFNSVTGLKAHVIVQHSYKTVRRKMNNAESPPRKAKDEHRCQICRRCFLTRTDLMVHETCHNKHSCYGCSQKFDTFKQLSRHRKRCKAPSNTAGKPKTLDDVISIDSRTQSPTLTPPITTHSNIDNLSDKLEEATHLLNSRQISLSAAAAKYNIQKSTLKKKTRKRRKNGYRQ
ncbi:uncharacterized protein LOC142979651 isoform X2 [Anticarsia gemmatalis]|uniref:uncharacterized protein LOC142979651 isoform X2 n=1 Tax=Anticarsia gemmatalis TaxID=129554 RepID=UPI003F75ACAF